MVKPQNFDLAKTARLMDLFQVPHPKRDATWVNVMLENVAHASFAEHAPQVLDAPDGFRYFILKSPPIGAGFNAFSVEHMTKACTEHGIGIVINPEATQPDWVFTYGDLWAYQEYGNFKGDPVDLEAMEDEPGGETVLAQGGDEVLVAQPSESYFPLYARKVVREYLTDMGLEKPSMFLLHAPRMNPARGLVFNIFKNGFENEEDFKAFAHRLTWYFPRSHRISFIGHDSDLAKNLVEF